jgi:hypothetical protein
LGTGPSLYRVENETCIREKASVANRMVEVQLGVRLRLKRTANPSPQDEGLTGESKRAPNRFKEVRIWLTPPRGDEF